jgi:hypothetical protein
MTRILVLAPMLALLLVAPASADPHREQITIESWSMSAPAATGKTMAASLLGKG